MNYSDTRYKFLEKRSVVWKEIVRYLESRFEMGDSILEVGCGYGDFISNVKAPNRFAVDLDDSMGKYLPKDVVFKASSIVEIEKLFAKESMSFIFSSNLLEHLSRNEIDRFFETAHSLLRPNGLLGIMMPNYKRAFREYFDDYTHVTPISDIGLADWLAASGYTKLYLHPGFMPFSVKDSWIPITPFLVFMWLRSPLKPRGKQMLIIVRKS